VINEIEFNYIGPKRQWITPNRNKVKKDGKKDRRTTLMFLVHFSFTSVFGVLTDFERKRVIDRKFLCLVCIATSMRW
jgi:hypothetical protein